MSVHRWLVAALVAAGLVAGSALAWRSSESYLRRRLAQELSDATGLRSEIGHLDVGPEGGVVRDVRLSGDRGEIRIDRVTIDTDPRALLSGDMACVELARIEGVKLLVRARRREVQGEPGRGEDGPSSVSASAGGIAETFDRAAKGLTRLLAPGGRIEATRVGVFLHRDATEGRAELEWAWVEVERSGEELAAEGVGQFAAGGEIRATARLGEGPPRARVALTEVGLSSSARYLPDLPWYRAERTRLDGTLDVILGPGDGARVLAQLEVSNAAVFAPYLSEEPIEVDTTLSGDVLVERERLTLSSSEVRIAQGRFGVTGEIAWGEAPRLDVQLHMPLQDCNAAMSVVPEAVLGDFAAFEWTGSFGGDVRLLVDAAHPDRAATSFDLTNECRFETVPRVADPSRFSRVFLHRVTDDEGKDHAFETGPGSKNWVPITRVSPFLVHAVLAHEDATFFEHEGFATFAIETALRRNLEKGRLAYGASTISMQLAKNLFLTRDKTLARKLREVFLTWWLESSLSKAEILELYLNVIEYGPRLYGIGPAARVYFGREPMDLTPGEAVFLASLLPAPRTYYRQFEKGTLSPGTKQQMASLLRHMRKRDRIDDLALRYGLAEIEGMDRLDSWSATDRSFGAVGEATRLPLLTQPTEWRRPGSEGIEEVGRRSRAGKP